MHTALNIVFILTTSLVNLLIVKQTCTGHLKKKLKLSFFKKNLANAFINEYYRYNIHFINS